ncbi:MAG: TonB family protein [Prevotellaceae bacterium]|jgi:protein TonB|nr:TonB family protein [Prevotellaceae bacterium]
MTLGKDIQINSQEWSDLLFEDKNKAYGAYQIRLGSSRRHIMAFVYTVIGALIIAVLPVIYSTVKNAIQQQVGLNESTVLADLQDLAKPEVPEENIVRQQDAPPPPPLKSTIQFTVPRMVDASEITDDKELKSQDELNAEKTTISVATVKGTDDITGIDIADLQEHTVVVEQAVEEVFVSVEQSPEFPGGIQELYKYIGEHLTYPTLARENGLQGKVTVRFVVEKNGSVSDVTVLRGFDPNCDKEAKRVVASLPKFQPGRQNGRAVRVFYTIPITFKLSND